MSIEDKLCYITLLCLASAQEENGLIRNCDEDTLIQLTGFQDDPYDDDNEYTRAKGCLERYKALHCVTLADNGDVTILNFSRRQDENLCNAERQKKYRERLKISIKPRNDSNTDQSNDSNARVDKKRIDKKRVDKDNNQITFLTFWNLYPKKVEKQKAEQKWRRLSPETQAVILKDLPERIKSDQWQKGFILNPMTYLNGERWNDEIQLPKNTNPPFLVAGKKV